MTRAVGQPGEGFHHIIHSPILNISSLLIFSSFFMLLYVFSFSQVSMAVIIGVLILYIAILTMAPTCKNYFSRLMKRMEEALAFRTASSLTFTSSFTSQSSLHRIASEGVRGSFAKPSKSNVPEASGTQ
ncbi:uncharacterized protein LOC134293771 isoform X1 [Anolis carolinensis]|uniref:uncharacterized protein LOC134293771 isoform X1 n=1 Tax=Anolis carolinensis TaxID=28377 RepID=UPI002F2B75DE